MEDPEQHEHYIRAIPLFRGLHYLSDGALQKSDLTHDGLHSDPVDLTSWHLVGVDSRGAVVGCARCHTLGLSTYESTSFCHSALAQSRWAGALRRIVQDMISRAQQRSASFAEIGGWCLAPEVRKRSEVLTSVMLMYALGGILGGVIGLATATRRHNSSAMLQRMGARKARVGDVELPAFYEPQFRCEIDLLEFDSMQKPGSYESRFIALREHASLSMKMIVAPTQYTGNSSSLLCLDNAIEHRERVGLPSSHLICPNDESDKAELGTMHAH